MDFENVETEPYKYDLNSFKDYEKSRVGQEFLPEYKKILEKQQDQKSMKEVEFRQMGQLSKEDQTLKEFVKEISEKIEDINIENNITQKDTEEFFQKQDQILAFQLTKKLQNNRTLYKEKLQKLRERIEIVRATQDMQYQNIKNEKEQQLMNAQKLLTKLQNEQRELRNELNKLKEEERKGSCPETLTPTAMTCDAQLWPQSKPKDEIQPRWFVDPHLTSVINSQNVQVYTNKQNTFETNHFDELEDLLLNEFLQPMAYQTGAALNSVANNQRTKQVELSSVVNNLSNSNIENFSQSNIFDNFKDLVSNEFLQSMVPKTGGASNAEQNNKETNQVHSTLTTQNIQVSTVENSIKKQVDNPNDQKIGAETKLTNPNTIKIHLPTDDVEFVSDPIPKVISIGSVKRRGPTLFTAKKKYFKRK